MRCGSGAWEPSRTAAESAKRSLLMREIYTATMAEPNDRPIAPPRARLRSGWAAWRCATASSSTASITGPRPCARHDGEIRGGLGSQAGAARLGAGRPGHARRGRGWPRRPTCCRWCARKLPEARLPIEGPTAAGAMAASVVLRPCAPQQQAAAAAGRAAGRRASRWRRHWSRCEGRSWPDITAPSTRRSAPTSRAPTTSMRPRSTSAAAPTWWARCWRPPRPATCRQPSAGRPPRPRPARRRGGRDRCGHRDLRLDAAAPGDAVSRDPGPPRVRAAAGGRYPGALRRRAGGGAGRRSMRCSTSKAARGP